MATTKNRLNISLPREIDEALTELSKVDNTPRATKATELLRIALELEEDQIWHDLALLRDTKDAKFISHDKIWKKYMK
jgi:hypothetical protein